MLIEMIDGPVKIDGAPVIKNVRLNIKDHQLRFKGTYVPLDKKHDNTSVDVVVYNWTNPKLDRLQLTMSVIGKELIRNASFNWSLSFDFFRRRWKLSGDFGAVPVSRELDSVGDILLILRDLVM